MELYQTRRRPLLALLMRIVRNPHVAEDLAQEAFLRLGRSMSAQDLERPDAFLRKTATNLAIDHERRQRLHGRFIASERDDLAVLPVDADGEALLLQREREETLHRALSALSPRMQEVWRLCYLDELSYGQIAERLGVSRNTVYNDVKYVVNHCRATLRELDPSR